MPKNKPEADSSDSASSSEEEKKPVKTTSKRKPVSSESDSSNSDSEQERRNSKKYKKEQPKSKEKTDKGKGKGGEKNSWVIGKNKFAKLTEFRGKWFVNIREFYEPKPGELAPTKKGIMLTLEQWQALKGHISDIDRAIKENV